MVLLFPSVIVSLSPISTTVSTEPNGEERLILVLDIAHSLMRILLKALMLFRQVVQEVALSLTFDYGSR